LLLLADTDRVWVITTVYEREVAAVLQAQRLAPVQAAVTVSAYPDATFRGTSSRSVALSMWRRAPPRYALSSRTPTTCFVQGCSRGCSCSCLARPAISPCLSRRSSTTRAVRSCSSSGGSLLHPPAGHDGRTIDGWVEVGGIAAGAEVVTRGAFLLKSDVLRSKMGAGCAD